MPAVLQPLMRHENVEKTLKYYVGSDAEGMADVFYAAMSKGDFSGDSATLAMSCTSTSPLTLQRVSNGI